MRSDLTKSSTALFIFAQFAQSYLSDYFCVIKKFKNHRFNTKHKSIRFASLSKKQQQNLTYLLDQ